MNVCSLKLSYNVREKNRGEDTRRCLHPPGVKIPWPGYLDPRGEVTGVEDTLAGVS